MALGVGVIVACWSASRCDRDRRVLVGVSVGVPGVTVIVEVLVGVSVGVPV